MPLGLGSHASKKHAADLSILDEIHMFKDKMKNSVRDQVEKKLHSSSSQFFKSKEKRKARRKMNSMSEKIRLFSILRQVPVCNMLSDLQVEELASSVVPRTYFRNDVIIKSGRVGHSMFIIEKGHAVVAVNGKNVCHLHQYDYFGEIALIADVKRTADVICSSKRIKLVELNRKQFEDTIMNAGTVDEIFKKNRTQIQQNLARTMCNSIAIFKTLSKDELDMVVRMMKPISFSHGDHIIKSWTRNDAMYIITSGKVNQISGRYHSIMKTLESKEYFGQENILDAKYVSQCDYVCDGPVEALYFHRFQTISVPQLKHQLGVHEHILNNDMLEEGYGPENILKMQGRSAEDIYKAHVGKDDYITKTMTLAELAGGGTKERNRWVEAIRNIVIPACKATFFDRMLEFYKTSYVGKKMLLENENLAKCFFRKSFNGKTLMSVVIKSLEKIDKSKSDLFILQAMLRRTSFYKSKLGHCKGYQLNEFAQNMKVKVYKEGEVIFDEGDTKSSCAFILLKGLVAITRMKGGDDDVDEDQSEKNGTDMSAKKFQFETLIQSGDSFGTLVLNGIDTRAERATAQCMDAYIISFTRDDYEACQGSVSGNGLDICGLDVDSRFDILRKVPLFQSISEFTLYRIALNSNIRRYQRNTRLLSENCCSEYFGVVLKGSASFVWLDDEQNLEQQKQTSTAMTAEAKRLSTYLHGKGAAFEELIGDKKISNILTSKAKLVSSVSQGGLIGTSMLYNRMIQEQQQTSLAAYYRQNGIKTAVEPLSCVVSSASIFILELTGEKLLTTLASSKTLQIHSLKNIFAKLKFVETSKSKLKNRPAKNTLENSHRTTDLVTKMAMELHERHFISDIPPFQPFRVRHTYFRLKKKYEEERREQEENTERNSNHGVKNKKYMHFFAGPISRQLFRNIAISNQSSKSTPSSEVEDQYETNPEHPLGLEPNWFVDNSPASDVQYASPPRIIKKRTRPSSAAVVRQKKEGIATVDTLMSNRVRENVNAYLKKKNQRPKSASSAYRNSRKVNIVNASIMLPRKLQPMALKSPSANEMSMRLVVNKLGKTKSLGDLYSRSKITKV